MFVVKAKTCTLTQIKKRIQATSCHRTIVDVLTITLIDESPKSHWNNGRLNVQHVDITELLRLPRDMTLLVNKVLNLKACLC